MQKVTSQAAKAMTCPFLGNCAGEKCMAWLWDERSQVSIINVPRGLDPVLVSKWMQKASDDGYIISDNKRYATKEIPASEHLGYCGMIPPDMVAVEHS